MPMLMSVIEFQDPTGEIMVKRVPDEGTAEWVTGSHLIVQHGQIAFFYRDGRQADCFSEGRHVLDTRTMPILSKLASIAYGWKIPFRAYAYFVQLKTFHNLGWGTNSPILFRDAEFKAVNLRANGSFSLRVENPSLFLDTLVGQKGYEFTFAIESFVRDLTVAHFQEVLSAHLTSILDLPARTGEIALALKQAVHDELAQYGLELIDLMRPTVTVPDEVRQALDRIAPTRQLEEGEVHRFQVLQQMTALREAAALGDGGAITAGLGLGAGMAVAQQMAANLPAAPPSPPPLPAAVQWHASIGGKQVGPFSQDTLANAARAGQLTRDTLVWRPGLAQWAAAGQLPELAGVFDAVPPPLPPAPPQPPTPPQPEPPTAQAPASPGEGSAPA